MINVNPYIVMYEFIHVLSPDTNSYHIYIEIQIYKSPEKFHFFLKYTTFLDLCMKSIERWYGSFLIPLKIVMAVKYLYDNFHWNCYIPKIFQI